MSQAKQIKISGKKYQHLKIASRVLDCSQEYVRELCSQGKLVCQKAGGAWYVEEGSYVSGKRFMQQKQLTKHVEVSLEREKEQKKNKLRKKRMFGLEIRG